MAYSTIQLPRINPYPNFNSVLVCDNAAVHRGKRVRDLCKTAGVQLLYLPPYCPELNPIEIGFAAIKSHLQASQVLNNAIDPDWEIQKVAGKLLTAEFSYKVFKHASYCVLPRPNWRTSTLTLINVIHSLSQIYYKLSNLIINVYSKLIMSSFQVKLYPWWIFDKNIMYSINQQIKCLNCPIKSWTFAEPNMNKWGPFHVIESLYWVMRSSKMIIFMRSRH